MKKRDIGIDHCKFELTLKNQQSGLNRIIPIINEENLQFGEIKLVDGKIMIGLCLPKYFDYHNAVPFKRGKMKYFDEISGLIIKTIRENFTDHCKVTLTSIEMNITEVIPDCDYEKVFLLLSHSLLDKVKQNARYEIRSDKSIVKPMTSGIKTRLIKGKWQLKAYDKQKQLECEYGFSINYKPIRIEFVYSRQALEKMFGNKRNFDIVFSKAGMTILINAYMETLKSLIHDYINPFLDKIHEQMMMHIRKSNSIHETYCEFKEVVYDQEQLRRVLKEWYEERDMQDNSRSTLSKLNKKYDLPKGALKFISELSTILD